MPTEAEWEYAARSGGKKEKFSGGDDVNSVAWHENNSGNRSWGPLQGKMTHPVGQKNPNGLGIHDMSGNVCEWVQDWYDSGYYEKSPKNNPKGPSSRRERVLRGGSWNNNPEDTRAAIRLWDPPVHRRSLVGFRCVMTK